MKIRRIVAAVGLVGGLNWVGTPVAVTAAPGASPRILFQLQGIQSMAEDGSDRRTIVAGGRAGDLTGDGSRLVYVAQAVDGQLALHVANSDGSEQQLLGGRVIEGGDPAWSPDARWVAYTTGSPQVVAVVGVDGHGAVDIAAGTHPDWSPDGRYLVYEAQRRLWVVEAAPGSPAVAITPPLGEDEPIGDLWPAWSPDGTMIAFATRTCLAVVHPDGSGLRCFDDRGDYYSKIVGGWSADSRRLVYSRSYVHELGGVAWRDSSGVSRSVSGAIALGWANPVGPTSCGSGYWLLGRDGGVFTYGSASFHGSTGGMRLNQPVVGLSGTSGGRGYWLVAADGGIFTFGDARFLGSTGDLRLKAPVVGMASTPTGSGYWLVAADGGIFTFGDARFFGSTGDLRLKAPVVAMAPTPSGQGYWLVARDGGIFTFGDARFFGSTGSLTLAAPIVGMAPTVTGEGYRLVGADGGTFDFGDASFLGSTADYGTPAPVTAVAGPVGDGLLLATAAGEVAALGDARFCGSAKQLRLAAPIVGAAVVRDT